MYTAYLDTGRPVYIVIRAARAGGTVISTKTSLLNTKLSICRKMVVSLTLSVDQYINLRKRISQSFRFYYRTNIYMLSELILCGIVTAGTHEADPKIRSANAMGRKADSTIKYFWQRCCLFWVHW